MKEEDLRAGRVWIKNFLPRTIENVDLFKRVLGNLHGISRICTHFVGSRKTDNRFDRYQIGHIFFQTKTIPPSLWDVCNYVMQFNYKKAHITGSVNTTAGFLSRLELKVTEKICLKI